MEPSLGEPAAPLSVEPAAVASAIAPLAVPWLRHDSFPMVKKVCSEGGLPQAKKAAVVRVLQELKRGRTHIEQQMVQLETQLLHVSDFLNGATDKLEMAQVGAAISEEDGDSTHAITANGEVNGSESHRQGKGKAEVSSDKTSALDPVAALVEEDLASDSPCTTVGLWRYLSFYSFFKTVTLEDMQEALLLDDPVSTVSTESGDEGVIEDTHDFDRCDAVNGLPTLEEKSPRHSARPSEDTAARTNELLAMRLLSALIPESAEECAVNQDNGLHYNPAKDVDMEDGSLKEETDFVKSEELVLAARRQTPLRAFRTLTDIGLIESTIEEVTHSMADPQDDEVSSEIRELQDELVRQVRRNNEVKRTLRRALERLKPWLTHDEEYQQIETKFEKMWRRKKELERKKKHKEKKQQRKEASYKSAFLMPPQQQVES